MIVVTGAHGQLGTALRSVLGTDAVYWDRTTLDLRHLEAIGPAIAAAEPDLVVNCAAYTAVDAAEEDPDTARLVNAEAVGALAAACARAGSGFVTFSSDYVFDGDHDRPYVESDPARPGNVYGATKLDGERRAAAEHPAPLIVRSSWVMSPRHRCFATTMIDLIRKGPVRVVDDQRGSPTFAPDLAAATMEAVAAGASGILHLSNEGEATWYEVAAEIAALIGADPGLVSPCTTAEFPRPARRPPYSVLGSERRSSLGIAALPDWRSGLSRLVAAAG